MKLIHADIVYSEDREHLAVHPDSYIAVEKGKVKGYWRFFVIRTDEIKAVSGIVSIIPMLDESPLIVSSAIKAVENR